MRHNVEWHTPPTIHSHRKKMFTLTQFYANNFALYDIDEYILPGGLLVPFKDELRLL